MDLEERVKISTLNKFYGGLLTDRQRDIVAMYVDNNLSLSEVSEELKITRQAVKDSLDKSINTLNELENKLNLYKKERKIIDILNKLEIKKDIKQQITSILEE